MQHAQAPRPRVRSTVLALLCLVALAASPPAPAEGAGDWGLAVMGVRDAWALGATGYAVPVAVIETGLFDAAHADYAGAVQWCTDLSRAPGACAASPRDAPAAAHASRVAGVVARVAPHAPLYLVTLANGVDAPVQDVRAALALAAAGPDGERGTRDDARVAVLSLSVRVTGGMSPPGAGVLLAGSFPLTPPHGLIVVAAAGNTGMLPGSVTWPAADPDAIGVGALEHAGAGRVRVAAYSAEGLPPQPGAHERRYGEVDVAAPGTAVTTSRAGGGTEAASGTSLAAPHVAGLAALFIEAWPRATPADYRDALRCGSEDLVLAGRASALPGRDAPTGWGLPRALPVVLHECPPESGLTIPPDTR